MEDSEREHHILVYQEMAQKDNQRMAKSDISEGQGLSRFWSQSFLKCQKGVQGIEEKRYCQIKSKNIGKNA